MMRTAIAVVAIAVIAGLAIGKTRSSAAGHLRPDAERFVRERQKSLRHSMDLLGLCAYLAATNRRLPDRRVLQSAYQSSAERVTTTVPFWGGASAATAPVERTPEPATAGQALG